MKPSAEIPASTRIPYSVSIDENTVVTEAGEYMQVIYLGGASFESADDEDLNNWHNRLNTLYRNIGNPHIMLYQHTVRRIEDSFPDGDFQPGSFAEDFNNAYKDKLSENVMRVNDLYLTIIYKPLTSILQKTLNSKVINAYKNRDKFFSRSLLRVLGIFGLSHAAIADAIKHEQAEAIETLQKTVQEVLISLDRYSPELLGGYDYKFQNKESGKEFIYRCSQPLEFFAFLINGEWQRIQFPNGPIKDFLSTSRLIFGSETVEIWTPEGNVSYGACLGIKEPSGETVPGFLNQMLTLPFNFVLTQSFDFQFKETSKNKIKLQRDRLKTTTDDAVSQQEGLAQALDDVTSNVYLFGDHHFNMIVYGAGVQDVKNNLGMARTALADSGMVVTREDAALEAAFWAQLPGNAILRPRVCSINSRNFAAFAPFHNFPQGKKEGNHWGPALMVFSTSSGAPIFFSYHASDPNDPDGGSRKDVGHALVLGPTGGGKTVFNTTTQTMLQKFYATCISLTKDYDAQICIQANGGAYFPIQLGKQTNFNPFKFDPTPENRAFSVSLLSSMLQDPRNPFTADEEMELSEGLGILWGMPQAQRRLRLLGETLNKTRENGLYTRLQKWIYDGDYAWVFDNEEDGLQETFATQRNIGFDVTSFLDIPEILTPINLYIFNRINALTDGRRLALFCSEFWKLLDNPAMQGFVKDGLKTQRKKNAFTVLDSQSPSDALTNPTARTLIEQTATKVLFPNPDAVISEYMDGLGCSEREVRLLKEELSPGSRMFLLKQGRYSSVCKLDLKGLHYYLSVLSARTANIEVVNALQVQFGFGVNKWLPLYKEKFAGAA